MQCMGYFRIWGAVAKESVASIRYGFRAIYDPSGSTCLVKSKRMARIRRNLQYWWDWLEDRTAGSCSSPVNIENLVENCNKLLEKFHYSWEMMPLVLVILNYAGSDLEEASRKIDEGKIMIDDYARKHNLNIFAGLELRNSTRQYGL
ncbi:unnamed protein product [Plutella xylostella]|uniref:(diamondback moth) hypothetical protein n=1 Tax=Plutella xylostella TaxID=51655 RepID=A0A8S4DZY0_PLUXY|nr:unnamed protein product [Plutella xylostella]